MNELSKYLCLLLRHQPDKAELDMDEHGWVSVEQLIDGVNHHSSYKLDRELPEQVHCVSIRKRVNITNERDCLLYNYVIE